MTALRRLAGLFHKSNNLKQAAGILFVTVLISNVLGLARNIIIANRVGLTYGSIGPLDTYYSAFALPDLLYNILIVGALSSAILPLLVQIDTEGDQKKFWRTFNVLISTGIIAVLLGLIVLYFVLPIVTPHLFPGFSGEQLQLTTTLSQVLLLSPLFFTVSQLSSSALQAKRLFFAPALSPIIYNLAIISSATLIPKYGLSVLVFGVVLGAAAHFLVQLPSLLRQGWRFQFELGFGNKHIARIVRLMIPRAIALTGSQLLLIVFYRIASKFSDGSIAIYRLTDDLQTAPVLLLANTLAMAILPDFARHFAKNQIAEFRALVGKALRFILYLFLPTMAFLLIFREQIIGLYISLGQSIDPSETRLAVATFSYFVISLFFQATVLLLARAFFAQNNTAVPTVISLVSLGSAWLLAEYFAGATNLGVAGLSLAFSIGSALNATLLFIGLRLPLREILFDADRRFNFLPMIGGVGITATVFLIAEKFAPSVSALVDAGGSVRRFVEIILGLLAGAIFYIAWSKVFKLEQWRLIQPEKNSIES
ncbi:MAG: lipid II flippase MurJ [Patescibacteria group bacterium]